MSRRHYSALAPRKIFGLNWRRELRGDIGAPISGAVDSWTDGTNGPYIQGTAAAQPQIQISGPQNRKAVDYDGGDLLTGPWVVAAGAAGWTMWLAMQFDSTAAAAIVHDATNNRLAFFLSAANTLTIIPAAGSQASVAFSSTNPHRFIIRYNGAGATDADKLQLYIDDVLQTLAFTGSPPATLPASVASLIGAAAGPAAGMNGRIWELGDANVAVTTAQRTALNNYLGRFTL